MTLDFDESLEHTQAVDRLTQGVVLEMSRERKELDSRPTLTPRAPVSEAQVRADVDRAMQAIKNAGFSLGALSDRSRGHEDTIRELKKTVAELKQGQDAANQKVAKAEARIRQEMERAQQAEARVRVFEGQIKQLELREKTIMGNLDRVMRLVDATFGVPDRAAELGLKNALS